MYQGLQVNTFCTYGVHFYLGVVFFDISYFFIQKEKVVNKNEIKYECNFSDACNLSILTLLFVARLFICTKLTSFQV